MNKKSLMEIVEKIRFRNIIIKTINFANISENI